MLIGKEVTPRTTSKASCHALVKADRMVPFDVLTSGSTLRMLSLPSSFSSLSVFLSPGRSP
jgi:hypothetical protein